MLCLVLSNLKPMLDLGGYYILVVINSRTTTNILGSGSCGADSSQPSRHRHGVHYLPTPKLAAWRRLRGAGHPVPEPRGHTHASFVCKRHGTRDARRACAAGGAPRRVAHKKATPLLQRAGNVLTASVSDLSSPRFSYSSHTKCTINSACPASIQPWSHGNAVRCPRPRVIAACILCEPMARE